MKNIFRQGNLRLPAWWREAISGFEALILSVAQESEGHAMDAFQY
jgi:hypothetical protein